MKTISNWTAKRAGGRITVYGVDGDTGDTTKVVGVDMIKGARAGTGVKAVIATDKDGVEYELV